MTLVLVFLGIIVAGLGYAFLIDKLNALPQPKRPDRLLCTLGTHPEDRSTLLSSRQKSWSTGFRFYYRCNLCGKDWETSTSGRIYQ